MTTPSTYADSLATERAGMALLDARWPDRFIWLPGQRDRQVDPLMESLQRDMGVDALWRCPVQGLVSVDLKAEQKDTGNLCYEVWSRIGITPGWTLKTKALWIYFVFTETGRCVIVRMDALREFFAQKWSGQKVRQCRRGGPNTSEFYLLPIESVAQWCEKRHQKGGPRLYSECWLRRPGERGQG